MKEKLRKRPRKQERRRSEHAYIKIFDRFLDQYVQNETAKLLFLIIYSYK